MIICPHQTYHHNHHHNHNHNQVAWDGYDEREERVYRRPPTYLIIASRIVRPSTIYQVCCCCHHNHQHYCHHNDYNDNQNDNDDHHQVIVSLLEESQPSRVRAALSRDGVEVRFITIIPIIIIIVIIIIPIIINNNNINHHNYQVYGAHVNMQPLETRKILLQVNNNHHHDHDHYHVNYDHADHDNHDYHDNVTDVHDNYTLCITQVPPGNNVDSEYKLRVEGAGIGDLRSS